MANIWSEFDKSIDVEGLKKDCEEAAKNGSTRREVPHDTYEVKIEKLEPAKSKNSGNPMLVCWMKILEGDYKNSLIFMNQTVHTGYGIHKANEFLRALVSEMEEPIEISWGTLEEFADLIMEVAEAIDGNFEYAVEYGENKGFNTFEIEEVYVLED